jgi:hypothetical protein
MLNIKLNAFLIALTCFAFYDVGLNWIFIGSQLRYIVVLNYSSQNQYSPVARSRLHI